MRGLDFIKQLSADEVFSAWQAGEGQIDSWQQVAKEKGWESWKAWRGFCFDQIKGREREWKLYAITDPGEIIPQFLVGPTQSWQKHFDQPLVHTFADLLQTVPDWVKENDGVQRFISQYPTGAQMMGFYLEERDQVMLFEGHHRCAAVALGQAISHPVSFEESPKIAIAVIPQSDEYLLADFLKRGTTKQAPNGA